MKSRKFNTSSLNWGSEIEHLFSSKKAKTIEKLKAVNINRLYDLIWIFPLRVNSINNSFDQINEGDYFKGEGLIIHSHRVPNFRAKGRNRVTLCNIHATVQLEQRTIELRWFNAYPNIFKSLNKGSQISFLGQVRYFNNTPQLISPKINVNDSDDHFIEYPTINSIPGKDILKLIKKIPDFLWDNIPSVIPAKIRKEGMISLTQAMRKVHGINDDNVSEIECENRIVYEELMTEQISLQQRKYRRLQNKVIANHFPKIIIRNTLQNFHSHLPMINKSA